MRAIVQERSGPPEVLQVARVPDPGQVRVRVAAAGLHLIDTRLRAGTVSGGPVSPPEPPLIPGREIAGDRRGPRRGCRPRVARRPGERPPRPVHRLPAGVEPAAAVAVLGTGRMAIGLLELAAPSDGDLALVTSAAGGIGTLLVQALRAAGADVIGAAGGGSKPARARAAGRRRRPTTPSPGGPTTGPAGSTAGARRWSSTASAARRDGPRSTCCPGRAGAAPRLVGRRADGVHLAGALRPQPDRDRRAGAADPGPRPAPARGAALAALAAGTLTPAGVSAGRRGRAAPRPGTAPDLREGGTRPGRPRYSPRRRVRRRSSSSSVRPFARSHSTGPP